MIKRVLKAPQVENLATLQLPLYASFKEDGIRCISHPVHGIVSQRMKQIPNDYIQSIMLEYCPTYLDGELVTFNAAGMMDEFNTIQSKVMSYDGHPDFAFLVFDWFGNLNMAYQERKEIAKRQIEAVNEEHGVKPETAIIRWHPQFLCQTIDQLLRFERAAVKKGKEGIMLRCPRGIYKQGRSTLNEQFLLKVKRFKDDEAIVTGVEEEMENCNPATLDAGGLSTRSKHAAGMRGKDIMGKLVCEWQGHEIRIGTGFTDQQRWSWWCHPELIIGKFVTFTFQEFGMKDLPRAPVFKGIRND